MGIKLKISFSFLFLFGLCSWLLVNVQQEGKLTSDPKLDVLFSQNKEDFILADRLSSIDHKQIRSLFSGIPTNDPRADAMTALALSTIGRRYFHYRPHLIQKGTNGFIEDGFTIYKNSIGVWELFDDTGRMIRSFDSDAKPFAATINIDHEIIVGKENVKLDQTSGLILFTGEMLLVVNIADESAFWFYPYEMPDSINRGDGISLYSDLNRILTKDSTANEEWNPMNVPMDKIWFERISAMEREATFPILVDLLSCHASRLGAFRLLQEMIPEKSLDVEFNCDGQNVESVSIQTPTTSGELVRTQLDPETFWNVAASYWNEQLPKQTSLEEFMNSSEVND